MRNFLWWFRCGGSIALTAFLGGCANVRSEMGVESVMVEPARKFERTLLIVDPGILGSTRYFKKAFVEDVGESMASQLVADGAQVRVINKNPVALDRSAEQEALKNFKPTHIVSITPTRFFSSSNTGTSIGWTIEVSQPKPIKDLFLWRPIYKFLYGSTVCQTGTLWGEAPYKDCLKAVVLPVTERLKSRGF